MSYSITNSDGTSLTILVDGTVDKSSTSLDLVSKNVSNYGQYINNNFVKLLENFASDTNSPPRSPAIGQLWYDKTTAKLKVYSGSTGFKSVGGALVASSQPQLLSSGDMWWDSKNNQLNIFNYEQIYLIGPTFPKSVGNAGWIMPSGTIISNTSSDTQEVILLENYGDVVGALSNSSFSLTKSDSMTYFNSDTTSTLVAGLNIFGNIQATGQITNNFLTTTIDYTWLDTGAGAFDWTQPATYALQNSKISKLLGTLFPVAASTSTNETGVPFGSNARVLCHFSAPTLNPTYHVRRFKIVNQPGVGISWQPYEVYANTGTSWVGGGASYVNISQISP
jgi:hypothetical protein